MITLRKLIIIASLLVLTSSIGFSGPAPVPSSVKAAPPEPDYGVLLYANNTLFSMEPDGANRTVLLTRAEVLGFIPLKDGRIFLHTKQYEGESLEILDPRSGVTVLVEFSEGRFSNIALSEDVSFVVYEVKHIPLSTEGDGIWLYRTSGNKSHLKISGTELSIESAAIFQNRVYILFHEIDLVSDEAGLIMESYPLDGKTPPRRSRIPEGMKSFVDDGFSLGFIYPVAGRRLQLKHVTSGVSYDIEAPPGDVSLDKDGYFPGQKPLLVFRNRSLDFTGNQLSEIFFWDISRKKIEPLKFKGLTQVENFRWSPDGKLYFTARYSDPSGEMSSPMLFQRDINSGADKLISVNGGLVAFIRK